MATEIPVPGTIALRGRFHVLVDGGGSPFPPGTFDIEWDTWTRQIELTEAANEALVRNDLTTARERLQDLISTHTEGRHPLPVIEAHIGWADAARQADQFDTAAQHLDTAFAVASAARCRFGTARAQLASGYLALQCGSARDALRWFSSAEALARELDDRVLVAGALTAKGEAHERLGEMGLAERSLRDALDLFEAIQSTVGIVNAAQRLGDLYRRTRHVDQARRAFTIALDHARAHGPWIGIVNALDGLGEIELAEGDTDAARAHFSEAYSMSEASAYRRGMAHALNGLGRVAFSCDELATAIELHSRARELYRDLEDFFSETSALDGLARAAAAEGDLLAVVDARLSAVDAIESVRAAQDRHAPQHEFRGRFRRVYREALRATVAAASPDAFVVVVEALAGRRLAGLVGAGATDLAESPELAAQMSAFAHNRPLGGSDLADDVSPVEKRVRRLGRLGLRAGLPPLVGDAIADVMAALWTPFSREAAPGLLATLRTTNALVVTPLPGRPNVLVALTSTPGASPELHEWEVPDETVALFEAISSAGLPPDAKPTDVEPLRHLVPPAWRTTPPNGDRLLIVPVEQLWSVPWAAVEVGVTPTFFGERYAITMAPSITLARPRSAPASPIASVASWRGPGVACHEVHAFDGDGRVEHAPLATAVEAKTALTARAHDLVVVAAHGRPVAGMHHYLELGVDTFLTPADLIAASVPEYLLFVSCWGAHSPERTPGEPLTLATIAVARGARSVMATVSELADDAVASAFVDAVLHRVVDRPFPVALREATARYLADGARRRGVLSRWAPLISIGSITGEDR